MHQSGKYSPTRYIAVVSPLAVALFHNSAVQERNTNTADSKDSRDSPTPEKELPNNIKMRNSKARAVKGQPVRKHEAQSPKQQKRQEKNDHYEKKREEKKETPTPVAPNKPDEDINAAAGGAPLRPRKRSFRPPDVRTIFQPAKKKDPRVKEERGEGHSFEPDTPPAFCDVCCQTVFQERLTCTGCKYTCHAQCRERVSLDCHQNGAPSDSPQNCSSQDQLNNNQHTQHDVEKGKELRTHFTREEIQHKVNLYNAATRDHLKMTLHPSGLYTGFIKVQLELRRPITVHSGGGGGGGEKKGGGGGGQHGGGEAFYLPRGAVNTLHVSSSNTVAQVIEALLNKFTVADNPAKFALYKRCKREEQEYMCKLAEEEQPLFLRLLAGPNTDTLSFVLREKQTGEVMWDAFSIPELQNFLRILEKEEAEHLQNITERYSRYRHRLEEALGNTHTGD